MAVSTEHGNLFVKRTDCPVHGVGTNHNSGPLQRRHTTAATRVSENVDSAAMLDPDYALVPAHSRPIWHVKTLDKQGILERVYAEKQ